MCLILFVYRWYSVNTQSNGHVSRISDFTNSLKMTRGCQTVRSQARFSREWDRRRPSRLLPSSYFIYFGSRRIYCSRQEYIHIFMARMPALFCLPNIPAIASYIQSGNSCLEIVNVQCAYIYIYIYIYIHTHTHTHTHTYIHTYIHTYTHTHTHTHTYIYILFFCCGAATLRGSWPPHS